MYWRHGLEVKRRDGHANGPMFFLAQPRKSPHHSLLGFPHSRLYDLYDDFRNSSKAEVDKESSSLGGTMLTMSDSLFREIIL